MGDINWDKMDVKKMGTPESASRRLLEALQQLRASRQAAKTAKKVSRRAVEAVTGRSGSRGREVVGKAVAVARKGAKFRAAAPERTKTTT